MNSTLMEIDHAPNNVLLTFDQTSQLLNLKRSKLRSMIFKNEIPVIRLGRCLRFSIKDLHLWLEEKKSFPLY